MNELLRNTSDEDTMIHKKLKIVNNLGLHARAAAKLVNLASRYSCKVEIVYNNKRIDSKSILSVMTLGATQGKEIDVIVDGQDEKEAINAIEELIKQRFGEKE